MPSHFSLLFCVNIDVCVGERGKVCIPAIYIMHSNPYSSQTFFSFSNLGYIDLVTIGIQPV
jgi:hypothetical protein